MPRTTRHRIVLVTAPDLAVGRRLARVVLEARLAACANLIPALESHYWWQGQLETGSEVLILFKTTVACLPELERRVHGEHPYDTPEFLVMSPVSGSRRYLDWISASVRGAGRPASRRRDLKPPGRPN